MQQTTDGGYIICGETNSFTAFGETDVYLIKTDNNGVEQWYQTYGWMYNDLGHSVQQTADGGYIICGSKNTPPNASGVDIPVKVYLIKTDANGTEQWSQLFGGGAPFSAGNSVQQTTDGGYIVCGWIYVTECSPSEVYLIKTDGSGNVTSTFNISINPNRKLEKVVDISGKQTKPQTNTPFIEIYDDGTVEKKIIIE